MDRLKFRAPSRLASYAALLLVAAGIARIVATYPVFNETSDEAHHVACGMRWLAQGDSKFGGEHPPLAQIAAAAGPFIAGLRPTSKGTLEAEGKQIFYSGGHYFWNLSLARMGILPFFILACALVWSWSKRLFGETTALVSTLLFSTLPPILAHSGLATTDMAVSTLVFGSVYAFSCWLERPAWKESALWGLGMALAALSKFSALVFLPACLSAIMILYWIAERPSLAEIKKGASRRISTLALAAAVAFLTIWAGYRFSFGTMPPPGPNSHGMIYELFGNVPLPAPELFGQLAGAARHNTEGHFSWLLGEYRDHGWWYFFLVALAVKTPIAFLLLCAIGYDACFSQSSWRNFRWQPWAPGVAALTILAVCMPVSINVGIRHILAIYPMLAIVAGLGAVSLFQTRKKAAIVLSIALLAWQTLASALAHPDYLPYFNELAGSEPERILVDSDLDWGQDVQRLGYKLKELGVKEVYWTYFWAVDPSRHGFPTVKHLWPYQRVTGWVAVNAYMMTIGSSTLQKAWKRPDPPWAWLESERPVARVGKSIKLYYIPPPER